MLLTRKERLERAIDLLTQWSDIGHGDSDGPDHHQRLLDLTDAFLLDACRP